MLHITYFVATSLDGFVADSEGQVDWLFHDADYGFRALWDEIDALAMGRRTYDQVLDFIGPDGPWPYEGKPVYVFSHQEDAEKEEDPRIRSTSEEVADFVERLEEEGIEHLWLVGGGTLAESFRVSDAIDDLVVSVHPILLGQGRTLFEEQDGHQSLELAGCETFPSGLVQLRYRVL